MTGNEKIVSNTSHILLGCTIVRKLSLSKVSMGYKYILRRFIYAKMSLLASSITIAQCQIPFWQIISSHKNFMPVSKDFPAKENLQLQNILPTTQVLFYGILFGHIYYCTFSINKYQIFSLMIKPALIGLFKEFFSKELISTSPIVCSCTQADLT